MKAHLQFLTTPTSDTNGTSIVLHFDQKRYIFGSLTEGTQRATIQQGVKTQKISELFVSGRTEWRNVGGLLGFLLTIADVASGAASSADELLRKKIAGLGDDKEKQQEALARGKKKQEQVRQRLTIFGPANLNYVLATARRFIFRTGMPLLAREIPLEVESKSTDDAGPAVFAFQDELIRVWALSVPPESAPAKNERKRSHDDMTGVESTAAYNEPDSYEASSKIVQEMFDSDWQMDRLFECSINEVKLPAKIYVRDTETKEIRSYTGPLPTDGNPVPDVQVLVRNPWPAAVMAPRLPAPKTSKHCVSYIVRNWPQRGKFDPKKALALGLTDKSKYGVITRGGTLTNDKGETITSDMVMGATRDSTGFVFADLPSVEYVRPFLEQHAAIPETVMSNLGAYVWVLGEGVAGHPDLKAFMASTSGIEHILTAPDVCPDRLSFDSAASATLRLATIDPARYKCPALRPQAATLDYSGPGTVADRGMIFNLEPSPGLSLGDITPPLDHNDALSLLTDEAKSAAETARKAIEDDKAALDAWALTVPDAEAEIVTLGTGSAMPSKYRNVSSTLFKIPGWGNLLLDAGEDTVGQLKRVFSEDEYREVIRNLRTIWISHLHADHHLGTASVVKEWYKITHHEQPDESYDPASSDVDATTIAGGDGRLTVVSGAPMLHWLWEYSRVEDIGFSRLNPICVTAASLKFSADTRLSWFYPHPSDGSKTPPKDRIAVPASALGFQDVQAVFVKHCKGALGVALTLPSGFKVSYSGDCRPSADFATIGRGSTVCVHEATFDDELRSDAEAKNHSTTSEALAVASAMHARAVLLTHFSQRYSKVPVLEREGAADADTAADPGRTTFRLGAGDDMKVAVAFDYMRVKVGQLAEMEKFTPALLALYDVEAGEVKARDKQRGASRKRKSSDEDD